MIAVSIVHNSNPDADSKTKNGVLVGTHTTEGVYITTAVGKDAPRTRNNHKAFAILLRILNPLS